MQAFHIPAPPPYYTNTFLLISDAGHAVIIDPAADVQNYEQILQAPSISTNISGNLPKHVPLDFS